MKLLICFMCLFADGRLDSNQPGLTILNAGHNENRCPPYGPHSRTSLLMGAFLRQQAAGLFEQLRERLEKTRGVDAEHDTMIAGQRDESALSMQCRNR